MWDRKNVFFYLKQDPDPGSRFKILICSIRIRPKMDQIRNPERCLRSVEIVDIETSKIEDEDDVYFDV